MIEIRCWRGEEEEKYKVSRQSSRERERESNHKRVSSYQCLNLQNRPDSLQGPQPYGEIHTPRCAYCVHKSAVNCHSENEFSETGSGMTRIFIYFFLAVTLSIIFNLGEEHTAIGTVRKLETLLRWQKTRLSYVHPRPRWRASGDAFSFFFKCTSATLSCGYRDSMTSDFFVLPFSYLCKLRMMLRIERIGSNGSSVRSYGERSPNFLS